jgi:serine/threonine-protein kinase
MSTHLRDQLQSALGGSYSVGHELGGGGMSRVFVADDATLGRQVVLKVLPPDAAAGISTDRFKREIALAARLQHPHIVPLLSAGQIGRDDESAAPLPYYAMPFVEGESLRQRLAKGGELPIAEGLRLLREVASALDYAHEKGIVHRDIKPDNVLLSRGSAMVTDFGVAKALSASNDPNASSTTSLGIALGTPAYMAPEQAAASPNIDARADLYAFGAMAYELFAGRPPFAGRSPQATLAAHVAEMPEAIGNLRPSVPPAVASLIMRCLEKNPADRPQSAAEVIRQLDAITTPGTTAPLSSVATQGQTRSKRRTLVGVTGTVVVAAMVIGFAVRSRGNSAVQSGGAEASIAVLPFENGGGDTTNDYLAEGIADELRSGLTKLPSLRVKSRSASMRFRGSHMDAKTAGDKLEVTRILQGTISRIGTRLHVTADLVNVANDDAVWSGTFDRPATDLGGIQDSIRLAVAAALNGGAGRGLAVSGTRDRGTSDPVAYDDFLKARFSHEPPKAILFLKDAVGRDPKFARGYAALADFYAALTIAGIGSRDSAMALASENLRKAEAIDSSLIEVYEARAIIATMNLELVEAAAALTKAVGLDASDAQLLAGYSYALAKLGRIDEALTAVRRARKADPLDVIPLIGEQYYLMLAHNYRDAVDLTRTIVSIDSSFVPALENATESYIFLGQPDSALIWAKRGFAVGGVTFGGRGAVIAAYAALGRWADVDRERELAKKDPPNNSPQSTKAFDLLLDGNVDSAMTALERSVADREPNLAAISIACEPLLDPLRSSPRFGALMKRLGARPCAASEKWPFPKRPK